MLLQADLCEHEMAPRRGDHPHEETGKPRREERAGHVEDRVTPRGSSRSNDQGEAHEVRRRNSLSHPPPDSDILARMELEPAPR